VFVGCITRKLRHDCDPQSIAELKNVSTQMCQRIPLMLVQCSLQTALSIHRVDTEICEQTFSWLCKYSKITRKMNKAHFMFYLLYICNLHNQREELKLKNSGFE